MDPSQGDIHRHDATNENSDAPPSRLTTRSTRRALLAAGGLTLATSGLFVPARLVEDVSAAGPGASHIQHRASKRRQRQRQRRTQRREADRKAGNAPPKGRLVKWIKFIAHNDRTDPPFPVGITVYVDDASVGTNYVARPKFLLANGATKDLAYPSNKVGFLVEWYQTGGPKTFIEVHNPASFSRPQALITSNGYMTSAGMTGGFVNLDASLTVNQLHSAVSRNWQFSVTRLADNADYVVVDVRFNFIDTA